MKYKVTVGISWETNDMGIANNGTSQKEVPIEKIVPGYKLFEEFGNRSDNEVVSFKDGQLVFNHLGSPVTLEVGHTWHSPMYRVDNPYIYEAKGLLVIFKEECNPAEEKKHANRVVALLKKMRKNAAEEWHPVWKNIPLAKELYDLINNKLPINGKQIDATGIMVCCDAIFVEELLDTRDVPRLCLEFLQLRKLANEARTADDEAYPQESILGVREADKIQNRLDFYISPDVSMEWWVNYVGAHLKFDPVERTPEWEENIYEVEKACARKLKNEPRGMGFCFAYWSVKRAELAKRGIDWHSPSAMNPRVMFD